MKLRARFSPGRLLRRLRFADSTLRESVNDAAAHALRGELQRRSDSEIAVVPRGAGMAVGSSNPADYAREFGTLDQTPVPWLAPVLPLALEPMRAAANHAAARAVSQSGKRKK
jgi:hypothetical protein